MQQSIETKDIRNESIIAAIGVLMLVAVFVFKSDILFHSSPLALLIIVVVGFLLSFKLQLPAGIFLFFGGLALAVHPLMFSSSLWLIPGGAVTGFAGSLTLINWWKQTEK